jgi:endonuclease I
LKAEKQPVQLNENKRKSESGEAAGKIKQKQKGKVRKLRSSQYDSTKNKKESLKAEKESVRGDSKRMSK